MSGFSTFIGSMAELFNRAVAWVSDPVDVRLGHYVYESNDLILPYGEPFVLRRVYVPAPAMWAGVLTFPSA